VTYQFLHEILEAVTKHGRKMMKLADRADAQLRRGKLRKLGVRFEIRPWRDAEILWERALPAEQGAGAPDPWTEKGSIKRTGQIDWNLLHPQLQSKVAPVRKIEKPAPLEATIITEVH